MKPILSLSLMFTYGPRLEPLYDLISRRGRIPLSDMIDRPHVYCGIGSATRSIVSNRRGHMSVSRGHGGPQIVLERCPLSSIDLIADLAQDDPGVWQDGAALTLRVHGWSYRQIARALRMSPATAWRRVRDRKRRLGSDHVT